MRYTFIKNSSSVHIIECTEMNCKTTDANCLFVSIFLKNLVWYLGVKGNLHTNECQIYILTGKVENGATILFNKTLYHC